MIRKDRGLWIAGAFWLFSAVMYFAALRGSARWIAATLTGVVIIGMAWGLLPTYRRSSLSFDGDELVQTSMFRSRRLMRVGAGGSVVEVTIRVSATRSFPAWILVDENECARGVALNRDAWGQSNLDAIRQRLGIPIRRVDGAISAKRARQQWPGSMPGLRETAS